MNAPLWAGYGAVLGAVFGSFIATLIIRWPLGRGLSGRSSCDSCERTLRWFELMPLASFVAQNGRCRGCRTRIGRLHVAVEIVCAAVGAVSLGLAPGVTGFAGALFGWLLVALAALDFIHFWLPDRLTGALALAGLASALADVSPALADRLIGGAAGYATLALIALVYRRVRGREGMGAGDPKLLGAIGLWTGWQALPSVLLGASAAGLAMALVLALRGKVSADTRLPFGTMLAAAAFPVWLYTVALPL